MTEAKMKTKRRKLTADGAIRGQIDIPYLLLVLILLAIGLMSLYSASSGSDTFSTMENGVPTGHSYSTALRQALIAVVGVALMGLAAWLPMRIYRSRGATLGLWYLSILLLVAVLVIGVVGGGARRWLNLGFFSFQPSELAKLAVIMRFAAEVQKKGDSMVLTPEKEADPKLRRLTIRAGFWDFIWRLALVALLVVLEPHFSATFIILTVAVVMMFIADAPKKPWIACIVLGLAAGFIAVHFTDYAQERLLAWRKPLEETSTDAGYQTLQSLIAIGSGGLTGLGFGASRQKFMYLPEHSNDFIFSIVCEEMGFIGAVLILILFALLIIRGYQLAAHAANRYNCLVCAGITTNLALQVILNVAVVTNLIPNTGISLPIFSSGGTALIVQLVEMGIVLSASAEIPTRVRTVTMQVVQ